MPHGPKTQKCKERDFARRAARLQQRNARLQLGLEPRAPLLLQPEMLLPRDLAGWLPPSREPHSSEMALPAPRTVWGSPEDPGGGKLACLVVKARLSFKLNPSNLIALGFDLRAHWNHG